MNNESTSKFAELPVSEEIHPEDVMWNTGQPWYYEVGRSSLEVICSMLPQNNLSNVARILDLPCGHGRAGRYLRAGFPDAEIMFCDIDRSGVDFCSSAFGGKGIYSQPELTTVDLGNGYDLIWVGSLFTHLDEKRTAKWLAYLVDALSEGGTLIATFHGIWGIEALKQISPEMVKAAMPGYQRYGYGYTPYDGTPDYGVSISKASKIISMAEVIPGTRILGYRERAWADNHDVLAISRRDRLLPWI